MPLLNILAPSEQVAKHLRDELARAHWRGDMPGAPALSAELGVDRKTVEAALRLLEKDGLLVHQGVGRRRRIELPSDETPVGFRVGILVAEARDRKLDYVLEVQRRLLEAGYLVEHASKTLYGLGRNVKRIARFVERSEADAWVILGGSREELDWFANGKVPAFALFGRARRVPIASIAPNKLPAMRSAVERLVSLGHRRIVLMCRPERRIPEPGFFERAFLEELENQGVSPGAYHLPNWDETTEGYYSGLKSLFRISPPTALIVDEPEFLTATFQFLAERGLRVPEDVSLFCLDPDPSFAWCQPTMAHIHWDSDPWVRRILRWAANVSRGNEDRRQSLSEAKFVDGGTIGPI